MNASKRDYYQDTIVDATQRRQQVFMKAYHAVEWRYVLVKKFYCLHYLSESYTQYAGYFPENPVALYQNVWTLQEKVSKTVEFHKNLAYLQYRKLTHKNTD
jgi:hypothetical protein